MLEALNISNSAAIVVTWLLEAVVFGTLLAGVTWLLTRSALRSARPVIHAAFWMIVLAKFVLPAGPSFGYSLSSLVEPYAHLKPLADSKSGEVAQYTLVDLDVAPYGLAGAPGSPQALTTTLAPGAAATAQDGGFDWLVLIAAAYLVGVLLVAGIRIAAYRRFVVSCARLPLAGRGVTRIVAAVCRRCGVRTVPTVRLSDQAPAPFVYGLFAPTLVLSSARTLGREELEAVLFHEIAHLRRFDLLTRHLQWLAGTLLFFWPIVAWVNRRIDLAREYACDEWALRHGRLRPGQYARCLLRAATPVRPSIFAYRPAAMAANVTHVERRIEMIMDHPKRGPRARGLSLLAGAALIAWSCFALTGAAQVPDDQNAATKTETHQIFVTDDGQTMEMNAAFPSWTADMNGAHQVFFKTIGDDGQEGVMTAVFSRQMSPEALAEFGDTHPNADANGDGNVSSEEHDAYLVALAMARPEAVIEQFPQADSDHDGALSAMEAATLVNGGAPPHMIATPDGDIKIGAGTDFSFHAADGAEVAGDPLVKVEEFDDGSGNVTVRKTVVAGDATTTDGTQTVDVDVTADGAHSSQAIAIVRVDDGSGVQQHVVQLSGVDGAGLQQLTVDADSSDGTVVLHVGDGDNAKVIELSGADGEWQDDSGELHAVVSSGDTLLPADVQAKVDAIRETIGMGQDQASGDATYEWTADAPLGPDGQPLDIPCMTNFVDPSGWLLDNIDAAPSADQVAGYVDAVREAPLANFMKMHPEADTDGDGKVSAKERDAFFEGHLAKVRQSMLERYPDADANGDGVLTNEELRAYFHAHGPASEHRARFKVITNHGNGDAVHEAVIRETSEK